ncbi:hypothetical protein BO82DRAFT_424788 [Aspergillus uvarum CBS 121591]|uniref:Malonyl-CoA:ACP transacylase (MAT) domain-containing protein n=1 Tax=Aspergillus uvarum CBS 121591 TaxID=1448315 RepID=A0A319BTM7_9EURO|nr:hypothetical protein BO82DRAFT_424788 [Aspergillus uvarum CBS 121591]PYH77006.1 hypothetical protein BO82DRAFT_424788 [Aspergillus uvarum CBS 121591]
MAQVAASYRASIEPFCHAEPTRTGKAVFISSVTGLEECPDTLQSASYWVQNLVSPVKLSEATQGILSRSDFNVRSTIPLVELGPHAALKGPIHQTLQSMGETRHVSSDTGSGY